MARKWAKSDSPECFAGRRHVGSIANGIFGFHVPPQDATNHSDKRSFGECRITSYAADICVYRSA